jgi:hypothetical protein
LESAPEGFDALEEVGEFDLTSTGLLADLDWLPALTTVRETALFVRQEPLSEAAVEAFLSRVEVGGESAVMYFE